MTSSAQLDGDVIAFAGPIELLLELVGRREVEVTEVSVAAIVDDFLEIVEAASDLDLEAASKFLLVAATLIQIKTRRLFPDADDIEIDEELLVDAERDVLLARLLGARAFADVAEVLRDALDQGEKYSPNTYVGRPELNSAPPAILDRVEPPDLTRLAETMFSQPIGEIIDLSHVQPVRETVTDAVARLTLTLPDAGETTFKTLCRDLTRLEAVVHFLALLELLKAGAVAVSQAGLADDIAVSWRGGDYEDKLSLGDWDVDISDGPAGAETRGAPLGLRRTKDANTTVSV